MTRILLGAILGSMFLAYRYLGRPLDGSAWEVKIRRQAPFAISRKDILIFDRGRFTSADKLSEGFFPSNYEASAKPTPLSTWQATLPGKDGSTLYWQGQIQGEHMEGTVIWTRVDGAVKRYSFQGKRKS